ncbi:hypothetical protein [Anabaena sp. UHCC 0399]|uniref:hypothetical protein n=1 Tax=Anabaena sp. UHCC 0399 TaxID=3110238 RepID=UPI002B21535D|nr:hypothetical protein [Anabaena sp. UHCC 0399]MEA5569223.1 hypothetical protein [Anabaena sp. UHCC 0399]
MTNNHRKITHEYQVQYNEQQYIVVRHRRIKRQRTRDFIQSLLFKMTVVSLLTVGFSGVAAMGCWGLEIIAANSNPTSINQYIWQARKNVCLGGMLVGLSGFLGSALLGACVGGTEVQEPKN